MFKREDMNETALQRQFKAHTETMLSTLDELWREQWAARGKEAPKVQNFEIVRNILWKEPGGEDELIVRVERFKALCEQYSQHTSYQEVESESSSNQQVKNEPSSDATTSEQVRVILVVERVCPC